MRPRPSTSSRTGSRAAIRHFTEYLERFPDDLGVRWLLNLAHMTLGEHPAGVDPRYRIALDRFLASEFDIGRFRDVGRDAGVDRFNQAGGAVMDDLDGDGRLDLAVTAMDPTQAMSFYHNRGDGTFEDRSESAGVTGQLGGLVCYQTDYNNDGRLDLFIPRGAWLPFPIRPSLLRNDGGGHFTDVTEEARLAEPLNSNAAAWADYDNDGWLDLFIACETQPSHLYRNRGDGTFEEVAARAGLAARDVEFNKGCAWIDYDNDRDPDLFVNSMGGLSRLYRNDGGRFTDVSGPMGIDGPRGGFSCWAWDYDNDGWLDLFATSYDRSLADVVRGLLGQTHYKSSGRLFHNAGGRRFEDRMREAGLDMVFAAMGSNFGDLDNDGFLDMYLGTGDPDLGMLVPNRAFRNVNGRRFAEITGSTGTGHLQKGHAVACGDYDDDGDVDIFIEMGGSLNGDKYHNILFRNPGQGHHWLTVKLIGQEDQPGGDRAAHQAGDRGRGADDDPPTYLVGQQLRGQPPAPDDRAGEGRAGRPARGRLADQRDDPGLPRHRRRPGHRDHRARRGLPVRGRRAHPECAGIAMKIAGPGRVGDLEFGRAEEAALRPAPHHQDRDPEGEGPPAHRLTFLAHHPVPAHVYLPMPSLHRLGDSPRFSDRESREWNPAIPGVSDAGADHAAGTVAIGMIGSRRLRHVTRAVASGAASTGRAKSPTRRPRGSRHRLGHRGGGDRRAGADQVLVERVAGIVRRGPELGGIVHVGIVTREADQVVVVIHMVARRR